MSTVFDAQALIAFVLDEPAALEVGELISSGSTAISAMNLAEAGDRVARGQVVEVQTVRAAIELLVSAGLEVRAVDQPVAWRAAAVRQRHYHRRSSRLSLADCVALATCADGDALATADASLLRSARTEGIPVTVLRDSSGRRPEL